MTRWRWALLLALAVPLAAAAFPPLPKPKENKAAAKDLAKAVQGKWQVTNIERGGALGKGVKLAYEMTVTIDGEKLARTLKLKDRELKAAAATFVLDATKSPAWFEVKTEVGKVSRLTMKGVVKVDGDKMIWTYTTGNGERPKKIDGDLGEREYRYTLKRVKP
jgi:uncharacterized protein (TIGR03067 family)